jgi:hypothetical protein
MFNDATFLSQQMLAPYQAQDAQNKLQAIQNIGASAMGGAEMLMRGMESATRIQAFQQEQDLNAYRMSQMLALDNAMQSRYGVKMAEVQADMMTLERDLQKFKVKQLISGGDDYETKHKKASWMKARLDSMGGMSGLRAQGGIIRGEEPVLDPSEQEFKDYWSRYDEAEAAGKTTKSPQDVAMQRFLDLNRQLNATLRYTSELSFIPEGAREQAIQQTDALRVATWQAAREAGINLDPAQLGQPDPVGEPTYDSTVQQDGQPKPQGKAAPARPTTAIPDQIRQAMTNMARQDPAWQSEFWSKLNTDPVTQSKLSEGIANYAAA